MHDTGFGFIARGAAPAIVHALRDDGVDGGLVVELGCGSGIAAQILVDAGYEVFGVDLSDDLLAIARERVPAARFEHGSLHDVALPAGVVAVVAMGEILSYAGIDDRLLARVRGSLAPGGLFVFDVAAPGREAREPRRDWHEGDGWLICVEAREHADERRLTRRIATFRASGDGAAWTRSDELHELTLYDAGELVERLTAAGFEDARVLAGGYGPGVDLPPGLPVVASRAPAL